MNPVDLSFPRRVALLVLLVVHPAFAEEHGAHVHGVAELDVVREGGTLYLDLRSPAMNIVGFEHAPADDADRATVARAVKTLKDGAALFVPDAAAGCRLAEAKVETELAEHHDGEHDDHDDGDHKHADHGDAGHDDDGHDDHAREQGEHEDHDRHHGDADDAAHDHEHEHEHSDVHAEYRYECAHPEGLRGIDVRLFAAFPATHEVHVRTVTEAGQDAVELNAERTRIPLPGADR